MGHRDAGRDFPGVDRRGLSHIGGMDVPGFLAGAMRRLPFRAALGLRAAVWLAALAPLFAAGRFATIAGLRPTEREKVVTKLFASRWYSLRSLMMILKTFGAFLYAGDAAVRARLTASPQRSLIPLRMNRAGVAP